jgi:hypothetical protein
MRRTAKKKKKSGFLASFLSCAKVNHSLFERFLSNAESLCPGKKNVNRI